MRGIEFLAPVEAMRGNLSGKQNLVYPTKDNSAWEAPSGVRSYARNYSTRYVGSKRAADGRKFFSVKQRSAVTNTPAQRQAQALLGASKPIVDFIMGNLNWHTTLLQMLQGYRQQGLQYQPAFSPDDIKSTADASLRHYLMRNLRDLTLIPRNKQLTIQPQVGGDIVVNNPWRFDNNSGSKVSKMQNLIVKFWVQLATGNPCYFYLNGMTGLADLNDTFEDIVNESGNTYNYARNNLGLTIDTTTQTGYIRLGSTWVVDKNGTYIAKGDMPTSGATYYTTSTGPA